jgi:hypothetical protein
LASSVEILFESLPKLSIIIANKNKIMIAPAYTITSRAATNGAPEIKNMTLMENNDTTKYKKA